MKEAEPTREAFDRVQWIVFAIAALTAVGLAILFCYWILVVLPPHYSDAGDVLKRHLAAIIGLPLSAVVSFVIVVLLRQAAGPIEIKSSFFTFTGATGPVILWTLCFSVIVWAISTLWGQANDCTHF
jgi:hypothetical protein